MKRTRFNYTMNVIYWKSNIRFVTDTESNNYYIVIQPIEKWQIEIDCHMTRALGQCPIHTSTWLVWYSKNMERREREREHTRSNQKHEW